MRIAFRKKGNQHIRTGHLFPAGGLYMNGRPLAHPLKPCGGRRLHRFCRNQSGQILLTKKPQNLAQAFNFQITGLHHPGGILILQKRHQQMLQRGIFMVVHLGKRQSAMKGLLKSGGQHDYSFSIRHCSGCWFRRA